MAAHQCRRMALRHRHAAGVPAAHSPRRARLSRGGGSRRGWAGAGSAAPRAAPCSCWHSSSRSARSIAAPRSSSARSDASERLAWMRLSSCSSSEPESASARCARCGVSGGGGARLRVVRAAPLGSLPSRCPARQGLWQRCVRMPHAHVGAPDACLHALASPPGRMHRPAAGATHPAPLAPRAGDALVPQALRLLTQHLRGVRAVTTRLEQAPRAPAGAARGSLPALRSRRARAGCVSARVQAVSPAVPPLRRAAWRPALRVPSPAPPPPRTRAPCRRGGGRARMRPSIAAAAAAAAAAPPCWRRCWRRGRVRLGRAAPQRSNRGLRSLTCPSGAYPELSCRARPATITGGVLGPQSRLKMTLRAYKPKVSFDTRCQARQLTGGQSSSGSSNGGRGHWGCDNLWSNHSS